MARRGGHASGAGSPSFFLCPIRRREWRNDRPHEVVRLGPTRPYRPSRALGARSMLTAHKYRCTTCGHEGWTNHIDILKRPTV